jgi:hypothetical protein
MTTPKPIAGTLGSELDLALAWYREAKSILDETPEWKPAKERFSDANARLITECESTISELKKKLEIPEKCSDCYGSGFEEIDHGHYPCRRGCIPNVEVTESSPKKG